MQRLVSGDGEHGFRRDDAAHGVPDEDRVHGGVDGGRGRRVGDFEVDDFVREPFFEARHAIRQVAARLELGVGDGEDGDFGERMLEDGFEVRREVPWVVQSAWCLPAIYYCLPKVSSPPCISCQLCSWSQLAIANMT